MDPYAPRVETTGTFAKTSRAIPRVGVSPELNTLAFETLTLDKPLHPAVVEVSNRFFVVRLKSRDVPDETKLAAERDNIEAGLVAGRRAQLVDEFTKVLKEKAKIEKLGTPLDGAA